MKKSNENYIAKVIIVVFVIVVVVFAMLCLGDKFEDIKYEKEQEKEFSEISYDLPDAFEDDSSYYSKRFSIEDENYYCSGYINSTHKRLYEDMDYWFKGTVNFNLNDEVSELERKKYNNNEVLVINKKNKDRYTYYYGLKSSNYYYDIEYMINDYSNGDGLGTCLKYMDDLLESVKLK